MNRVLSTKTSGKLLVPIVFSAVVVAAVCLAIYPKHELRVIDETLTLEVYTPYGSFSGVAVGPHLILTVAHGANLPVEMTVNHYKVVCIWLDEQADLALLQTDETFYLYSELAEDHQITRVASHELGPGDSGTAIINKSGTVCFLLQGYDHTAGKYVYNPITKEAIEAVRSAMR